MSNKQNSLISFAEYMGGNVRSTAEVTAKGAAGAVRWTAAHVKKSITPIGREAVKLFDKIAVAPARSFSGKKENSAEAARIFKRRIKMFGFRRAAAMQWKENLLAIKRRGNVVSGILNIVFPAISVCALVLTVNSVMSTDYGVAVEYDGEEMGVVSGEEVLGDAQSVVADRVKYYDTDGDYYVTAALAIKPLSSNDSIMDEELLAEKMENRISEKFVEKPLEDISAEEEPEDIEGKIKAYAVRIDGEFVGAVESYDRIATVLEEIKKPYDTGEYTEIGFDKDIEFDLEEYVYPEELVADRLIINKLKGFESGAEYYEVQPGDNLWNIAESKGMTLQELCSCYATYNGKVIEDIEHSILKAGTLIKLDSEVPFLQVECRKEVTLRSDIQYETITIEDPTLPAGQSVVSVQGENGEKRSRAIVTYREGKAVRKKTIESVVYREPVTEIIKVGTAKSGSINYNVPEFISDGGTGDYFWPVDGGYISAHQGDGRGHKGIDIAAPFGTPIYAASSGTVVNVGSGWNGGYGNAVEIQNDDGNLTVYAHMAETVAEVDSYVEAGQLIGYVGSTGDSNGNHLHFEVRKDGKYYDPELYVSAE